MRGGSWPVDVGLVGKAGVDRRRGSKRLSVCVLRLWVIAERWVRKGLVGLGVLASCWC